MIHIVLSLLAIKIHLGAWPSAYQSCLIGIPSIDKLIVPVNRFADLDYQTACRHFRIVNRPRRVRRPCTIVPRTVTKNKAFALHDIQVAGLIPLDAFIPAIYRRTWIQSNEDNLAISFRNATLEHISLFISSHVHPHVRSRTTIEICRETRTVRKPVSVRFQIYDTISLYTTRTR